MSKLHKSSGNEFKQISEEELRTYNNFRAEQYANTKAAKAFWGLMMVILPVLGVVLELGFPTKDAIFAIGGFIGWVGSLLMHKICSVDRS